MTVADRAAPRPLLRRLADPQLPITADLAVRWSVIIAGSVLAFRHTVAAAGQSIVSGLELSYLPAVLGYAVFAVVAVRRSRRPVIEIHDRETDGITGGIAILLAVMAGRLLAPTLGAAARLWRIDLLMLWVFTLGAAILLFGLRRALQYHWAWLTLGLIWPLPARILTYVIGDGSLRWVAGAHLAMIIWLLILGRRPQQRLPWLAPVLAATAALPTLLLDMDRAAPLVIIPPVVAIIVGAAVWLVGDRVGAAAASAARPGAEVQRRKPAVGRTRASVAAVAVAAVVGTLVVPGLPQLSRLPEPPTLTGAATIGDLAPAGWRVRDRTGYPDAGQYFGRQARWERMMIQAAGPGSGPEAVDPDGRHRLMAMDVLTTERPRTLDLFSPETTYPVGTYEMSAPQRVDLGSGVTGSVYAAVDPRNRLTWSMLTFQLLLPTTRVQPQPDPSAPEQTAVRVTLILVDDHRPGAPFPEPARALPDNLTSVLTAIIRGRNTATLPVVKNADLLTETGRRVLATQVGTSG